MHLSSFFLLVIIMVISIYIVMFAISRSKYIAGSLLLSLGLILTSISRYTHGTFSSITFILSLSFFIGSFIASRKLL